MAFAAVHLGQHWMLDALARWIVATVRAVLAGQLVRHFAADESSAPAWLALEESIPQKGAPHVPTRG
jgi:membrane-associated phospholipid phosphatase